MDSEKLVQLENRLWSTADELRANSRLKSSEYSVPVLGLIFLRYADIRFHADAPVSFLDVEEPPDVEIEEQARGP